MDKIIAEYYDSMADISIATSDAVDQLGLARKNVQEALIAINQLKKQGDTLISPVSSLTTKDTQRNLLFLELLLNLVFGLIQTPDFQELLDLTNYSNNEENF
jgi:hypothetical protein